ncbi:zinc-binding dehydrogenase [Streptomyces sp. S465]|uniref:zinc-binding dehydrogenase n=1 Tax=Streptomyces sp. S465 TaxID=2979468 RepID=UPI0022A820B8|nr:zinc-binding dehydrogenase [Streptomyces sp. S465]WAP54426.1 zinc-binding dehydrogenase [Streptomyces sp. S465]
MTTLPTTTAAVWAYEHGGPDRLVHERKPLPALGLGGRLCPAAGEQSPPGPLPFTVFDLTRREADIVGVRGARHDDALRVMSPLADGRLRPPIAARFPLSRAAQAHDLMENGTGVVGRILLKPGT